jgi:hypothetical protein
MAIVSLIKAVPMASRASATYGIHRTSHPGIFEKQFMGLDHCPYTAILVNRCHLSQVTIVLAPIF